MDTDEDASQRPAERPRNVYGSYAGEPMGGGVPPSYQRQSHMQ